MSHRNLKNKLNHFEKQLKGGAYKPKTAGLSERYILLNEFLEGELMTNFAGAFCQVKDSYPLSHTHGLTTFTSITSRTEIPLTAFSVDNNDKKVTLDSLLFFDTETTGLGGSGVVAFLVGCGSVVGNNFEIRQYLIPDYSDETAVLEALLEEFLPDKNLVSFNGAAFDLPLLRDRMIINRVAREIKYTNHIDLLHSARRIYKRRLKDCTLINLERELLSFYREDDIPGYLIPSVYFEWLSEQKPDMLKQVLIHNKLDILSMYYIICLLARVFESEGDSLDNIEDLYSLSRLYGRRKEVEKTINVFEKINDYSFHQLPDEIAYFHSLSFKRSGAFEKAVLLWVNLSNGDNNESFLACLELSKYYEHNLKDYKSAFQYAQKAVKICPKDTMKIQLNKRLARLNNKINF